jgi:hypothetical protein
VWKDSSSSRVAARVSTDSHALVETARGKFGEERRVPVLAKGMAIGKPVARQPLASYYQYRSRRGQIPLPSETRRFFSAANVAQAKGSRM